mmetsp:Transcript_10498/g.27544  ORF Transcript_10498/g.27544 Transcript_10498/m.27544 type:complete len:289 (-) Transcript_10498:316-1182(-)
MSSSFGQILGLRDYGRKARAQPIQKGSVNPRRDLVTTAIQNVLTMVSSTDNEFGIRDAHAMMPEYSRARDLKISGINRGFPVGWAQRLLYGDQYGRSNLEPYKLDNRELFEKGERESSEKMNATMIVEQLTEKYNDRFTLPGKRGRKRAAMFYDDIVEAKAAKNVKVTPKAVRAVAMKELGDRNDFEEDLQRALKARVTHVRRRVESLRQTAKKKPKHNSVATDRDGRANAGGKRVPMFYNDIIEAQVAKNTKFKPMAVLKVAMEKLGGHHDFDESLKFELRTFGTPP